MSKHEVHVSFAGKIVLWVRQHRTGCLAIDLASHWHFVRSHHHRHRGKTAGGAKLNNSGSIRQTALTRENYRQVLGPSWTPATSC